MEKWWCDLHSNIKLFHEQIRAKAFKLRGALWNCLHKRALQFREHLTTANNEPSSVEKPTNWKCSNNRSWLSRVVDSLMASSANVFVFVFRRIPIFFYINDSRTYGFVRHNDTEVNLILVVVHLVRGGEMVKYCWIFHYHTTKCVYTRQYWEKANETKCRKWLLTISQTTANSILTWWFYIEQWLFNRKQSPNRSKKKKEIMHLERAEEFLLFVKTKESFTTKKEFHFILCGLEMWCWMHNHNHKWTAPICGNSSFQAYLFFILNEKCFSLVWPGNIAMLLKNFCDFISNGRAKYFADEYLNLNKNFR